MKDQPKPTTGEWTVAKVKDYIGVALDARLTTEAFKACDRLASAVNAALAAAKQEGIDWADKQYYGISGHQRIRDLEQQLAVEREPKCTCVQKGYPDQGCQWHGELKQLREQLAAAEAKIQATLKLPSTTVDGVGYIRASRVERLLANTDTAALDAAIRDSHKRLYDLVRYCRANLHQAKLITDDEYARLVETGSESARRLEDYEQAIAAAQNPLVDELNWLLKYDQLMTDGTREHIMAALAKVKEWK